MFMAAGYTLSLAQVRWPWLSGRHILVAVVVLNEVRGVAVVLSIVQDLL